jgi:hypothetical protein
LIIIIFQLQKAAMNSPHLCKLRKDCFTTSGYGTIKKQGGALKLYRASRGWGRQKLLKISGASPFNKNLSNDTTFSLIRIAGQYL